MKRIVTVLLLLAWCYPAWSVDALYRVKAVEDGDTLVIVAGDQDIRVQLLGIDAPEDVPNPKFQKDQERSKLEKEALLQLGRMASTHLQKLTVQKQVRLEGDLNKKDRYGRVPMLVFNPDGRSLNAAMIEDGYAVVMGRYPLPRELKGEWSQLERRALSQGVGLWSEDNRQTAIAWAGK